LNEAVHIKLQIFCYLKDFFTVEVLIILKQCATEGPEFALVVRCHGSLRCLAGETMPRKREVFHHQFDLVRILIQHLLDKALNARTVGSLVVIKDSNGYGRISGSLERAAGCFDDENGFYLYGFEGTGRAAGEEKQIRL
jgi:hypothetical protein